MRHLSPTELKTLLERPPAGLQLLDVRLPWEHETVHLPGSILIPMHEIPKRAAELSPAKPLVVYCHHGVRSLQVAIYLERAGFRDVANLQGGIDRYAEDVEPALARY